jgi:hypothetical protein
MSHKTLLLLFGNSHEKSLIILVIQIIMYINFYSRKTDPKCIKKKKKKIGPWGASNRKTYPKFKIHTQNR